MPFWMMMASCRDLLAHRSGQAKQRLRPAQVGADVRDGWWSWLGQVRLQPLFQDGLDGAVVRVAIGQRPLAGGVQAHLTVLLRQADDALALPQVMQMVLIEQLVDGSAHVLAELAGLLAAPGRRALEEGRLLRWVIIPIRLPLAGFAAQMRLGQLCSRVEAHELGAEPHVQPLAD